MVKITKQTEIIACDYILVGFYNAITGVQPSDISYREPLVPRLGNLNPRGGSRSKRILRLSD